MTHLSFNIIIPYYRENFGSMNIEELITSYGGFVYSDETKSMPKDYLTSMVETYIVFPNKVSQTGKVPKYAEKYIKLSLTNNWPIINRECF